VTDACNDDIQVALTEACTNVLRHAQGNSQEYEVTLQIDERKCEISVDDAGAGFEQGVSGSQIPGEVPESGRGIHLMRTLVDDVRFDAVPGNGTVVRLEKDLVYEEGSVLAKLANSSSTGASVSSKQNAGAQKS
jgi:serine/threonine-protein kinase RsbW